MIEPNYRKLNVSTNITENVNYYDTNLYIVSEWISEFHTSCIDVNPILIKIIINSEIGEWLIHLTFLP